MPRTGVGQTSQKLGAEKLWEGRFKSCVISAEEYFFICQRYIELNPVRANMVAHPADPNWTTMLAVARFFE